MTRTSLWSYVVGATLLLTVLGIIVWRNLNRVRSSPTALIDWRKVTLQGIVPGSTRTEIEAKLGSPVSSEGIPQANGGVRVEYRDVHLFIRKNVLNLLGSRLDYQGKLLAEVPGFDDLHLASNAANSRNSTPEPIYRQNIVKLFGEPERDPRSSYRDDNYEHQMVYRRPHPQFSSVNAQYSHEFTVVLAPSDGMVTRFAMSWKSPSGK